MPVHLNTVDEDHHAVINTGTRWVVGDDRKGGHDLVTGRGVKFDGGNRSPETSVNEFLKRKGHLSASAQVVNLDHHLGGFTLVGTRRVPLEGRRFVLQVHAWTNERHRPRGKGIAHCIRHGVVGVSGFVRP